MNRVSLSSINIFLHGKCIHLYPGRLSFDGEKDAMRQAQRRNLLSESPLLYELAIKPSKVYDDCDSSLSKEEIDEDDKVEEKR